MILVVASARAALLIHCLKSASAFFKEGDNTAIPVASDMLIVLVSVDSNTGKRPFKTVAGGGSKEHDCVMGLSA
jgi:hypothetical protein